MGSFFSCWCNVSNGYISTQKLMVLCWWSLTFWYQYCMEFRCLLTWGSVSMRHHSIFVSFFIFDLVECPGMMTCNWEGNLSWEMRFFRRIIFSNAQVFLPKRFKMVSAASKNVEMNPNVTPKIKLIKSQLLAKEKLVQSISPLQPIDYILLAHHGPLIKNMPNYFSYLAFCT